jgi:hypothetical protein
MEEEKTKKEFSELVKELFKYWFKTGYARFLSSLVLFGVGLLGLTWADIMSLFLGIQDQTPDETQPYITLAQVVGLSLIVLGIIGRTALHFYDMASQQKKEKEAKFNAEKAAAATLAAHIDVMIGGFEDTSIERDDTYYNVQIIACVEAAKAFLKLQPANFIGNVTIIAIGQPKFVIPSTRPFFNVETEELSLISAELRKNYAIK